VAIRSATRPVFHKGNSSTKEKEKRTKKRKRKQPVENAAAMEIRTTIGRLRRLLLDADSHSCLEKPRASLGFPTFTTGPTTVNKHETDFHLRHYKGGRAKREPDREA
jgi:hypothetical protein